MSADEWLKKLDADIIFCQIRIWLGPDKRQGVEDAKRLLRVYERTMLAEESARPTPPEKQPRQAGCEGVTAEQVRRRIDGE